MSLLLKEQDNVENLYLIGVDYKSSPIEIRERFSFGEHNLYEALNVFSNLGNVILLSTCNRTEIYISSKFHQAESIKQKSFQILSNLKNIDINVIAEHVNFLHGESVINHLFRVSSGLESMIIGEGQILNQVKNSYLSSKDYADSILNQLFQKALAVGKKARSQTGISRGAMSVPAAALQSIQEIIDPAELYHKNIMLLGAGEVSKLCLDHLHSQGATKNLTIVSRSDTHQLLLTQYGISHSINYHQLYENLINQDIILVCTSAPHYVLSPKHFISQTKQMIVCDMSLPRNVDPEVSNIKNVTLIDIDYLQSRVNENKQNRSSELDNVQKIIRIEIEAFKKWFARKPKVKSCTYQSVQL
ncbi:MAG: glutamyl-tRNA reductase [Candidatus Caenarcaniphilales bacterium]|nr:glutamyl-tRNA reductase [Candidatus Caenarcaniphilales bacterium]